VLVERDAAAGRRSVRLFADQARVLFYFANDARRNVWFYKGKGRVVFANGNIYGGGTPEVIDVEYDPSESGVAR